MNKPGDKDKTHIWQAHWDKFESKIKQRLEAGAVEYGDISFHGPLAQTLDELEQEVLDQIGWSFIALVKIWKLQEASDRILYGEDI